MILNNRFEIIKEIGAGGMGKVYLAEDLKLKRKVAVKRISDGAITDKKSKARFLREAQTASSLDHNNICTIYEIYNEDEKAYIVMQFVDGITLDKIINSKKLSINKIIDISIQICDGMIEAHSKSVIHRDIKPSNIMIDKKGIAKILDFGLAKFEHQEQFNSQTQNTKLTEQGAVMGTVAYMSPEQALGKKIDKRTDVFSFGTVLFELIEGDNPFLSEYKVETLYNVINRKIKFKRNIPIQLKKIVEKILNKNKKKRYDNFQLIKDELLRFKNQEFNHNEKGGVSDSSPETELINSDDVLVVSSGSSNTSDNEALGDMVRRIRNTKGTGNNLLTNSIKKMKSKKLIVVFSLILLIILSYITFILFIKENKKPVITKKITPIMGNKPVYIRLHSFETQFKKEKNSLAKKINYLLMEFLNQSDEVRIVSNNVIHAIRKSGSINDLIKDIQYELKGRIFAKDDIYTIDAELISIKTGKVEKRFTKTGVGKDSILSNQIDSLSRELSEYFIKNKVLKNEINLKNVSKIYGNDWSLFDSFYRGLILYRKLDIEKSIKIFKTIENNPMADYYLANLYYFKGEKKRALNIINRVIPFKNDLIEAMKFRVFAFKAQLDYDFKSQIKYLSNLKKKFPFSKEIFFEIGEAYFHHGNAYKASESYKRAIMLDKNYSQAINHLGYCYSYMGKHDLALEQFQLYRTKDKFSANSLDSLGDGYFYKGNLQDALSMKISAVKLSPEGVSWAYLTIADILIMQAKYNQAKINLVNYKIILTKQRYLTNKVSSTLLTKRAFIKYLNKEYKQAIELLQNALKKFNSNNIIDNNAQTHWLLGVLFIKSDEIKKAEIQLKWLKNIVEKYDISENNYYEPYKYYLHLKALLLEKKGDLDRTETEFHKLIRMKTQMSYWITYYNYQFFYNEYIAFLNRNGKYQEELKEIENCLKFNNNYIPTLWEKAFVLEKRSLDASSVYSKIESLYSKLVNEKDENNNLRRLLKLKLSKRRKNEL